MISSQPLSIKPRANDVQSRDSILYFDDPKHMLHVPTALISLFSVRYRCSADSINVVGVT